MVFVGHSMGGLVSKLLTVDSGQDFWHQVSTRPFESLKLPEDGREELRRVFFFEKQPCVRRVIFIGTPHHGSSLSPSVVGRLADRLVSLPKNLMTAAQELAADNPDVPGAARLSEVPTSIDLLAPGAPALELLAAQPKPPRVHYHSIIGVAPYGSTILERLAAGSGRCEESDGIVPYRSAHLPDADSERVVTADHFHVHHHPLAILEVRRILLEHLREVAAEESGIVPVSGVEGRSCTAESAEKRSDSPQRTQRAQRKTKAE
jgi:hypothetical protein